MVLSTTPHTWAVGEFVTAAEMNTEIRDPLTDLQAAWTAWTPALTAVTTNPTLGTGGATSGQYCKIGRLVTGWGYILFGTAGTNAGSGSYAVSLPFARVSAQNYGYARMFCTGLTTHGVMLVGTGTATCNLRYCSAAVNGTAVTTSHAAPGAWTANDYIVYQFTYEATT